MPGHTVCAILLHVFAMSHGNRVQIELREFHEYRIVAPTLSMRTFVVDYISSSVWYDSYQTLERS